MDDDDDNKGEDRGDLVPPLRWPSAEHSLTKPDPNWTLTSSINGWSR